ncbi:uncharacterized protein C8Q71DRAFT_855611 [Rhodofomes roseus]|uniref:Chromo domain-containing protein n=1 Tax=Rhodofomes roseus TaxID=34475 RepID=A0ABQ8KPL7_9APHY|nr:uncharacterized protein C8Q71DRAFT_855611 [Rhodofomes roseus]KAH9840329.1 hypothetical protein C8Q71DRAFT_855611 [Rhodofomes roseus]
MPPSRPITERQRAKSARRRAGPAAAPSRPAASESLPPLAAIRPSINISPLRRVHRQPAHPIDAPAWPAADRPSIVVSPLRRRNPVLPPPPPFPSEALWPPPDRPTIAITPLRRRNAGNQPASPDQHSATPSVSAERASPPPNRPTITVHPLRRRNIENPPIPGPSSSGSNPPLVPDDLWPPPDRPHIAIAPLPRRNAVAAQPDAVPAQPMRRRRRRAPLRAPTPMALPQRGPMAIDPALARRLKRGCNLERLLSLRPRKPRRFMAQLSDGAWIQGLTFSATGQGVWIMESTAFEDGPPQQNQGPIATVNGVEQYEFEAIVSHGYVGTSLLYEIRWTGWDDTTWEPSENFDNTEAASDYWNGRGGPA